jgi:hypothetical protein
MAAAPPAKIVAPAPPPSPRPIVAPAPPVAPVAPVPGPSRLAEESRLVGEALRRLGTDHDPRGALDTLDRYLAAFPAGRLRPEADRARIEALLGLGRRRPALSLLDRMPPAELGDGAIRVARGELRAEGDRFAEAISDFDAALAAHNGGALDERALYGRAVCRARRHDRGGATRDYHDYLTRFPGGRFAADATRALGL